MSIIKGPTGQYYSIQSGAASATNHQAFKIAGDLPSFDMSEHAEASAQIFPI